MKTENADCFDYLTENYKRVTDRASEAAARCGNSGVRIMAVTKTVPPEAVNRAISLGIDLIGENRIQEFLGKRDDYAACETHFIGSLQPNKVKYIIDKVSVIQSVDSVKLAEEISARAVKAGLAVKILFEVNIADEQSKGGVSPDGLAGLISAAGKLEGVIPCGVMAIPPATVSVKEAEQNFSAVRELYEQHKKSFGETHVLSIGMSNDFELAIKHGATLVRIGTALFGKR